MTENTPLVSVIMPVYNADEFLNEAVDSVLAQSCSDWELILVDDGSRDRSGAICDEYALKDLRIRVVHQKNQGVSAARNIGLELARGQWVQFLDADDIMLPQSMETLLKYSHEADMVVCAYVEFPEEEIRSCVDSVKEYTSKEEITADFLKLRYNGFFTPPWNKLYRKNCLGIRFDKTKVVAEDVFFSLSYLPLCKTIRVIPDVLFRYRLIKNRVSLSRKFVISFPQITEQTWHAFAEVFHRNSTVMDMISQELYRQLIGWTMTLVQNASLTKAQKLLMMEIYLGESLTCKHKLRVGRMPWKKRMLWYAILRGKPALIYWMALINK